MPKVPRLVGPAGRPLVERSLRHVLNGGGGGGLIMSLLLGAASSQLTHIGPGD